MYSLHGLIGRLGFWLNRRGETLFKTRHKFGIFPSSYTTIFDVDFKISATNVLGDKLNIIKDGEVIGQLDFSYYRYALIKLGRVDGGVDKFRLDEERYSRKFTLTGKEGVVMHFKMSLNPVRFDDKYDVEIVSDIHDAPILIELMFHAGELLFRRTKPESSPF